MTDDGVPRLRPRRVGRVRPRRQSPRSELARVRQPPHLRQTSARAPRRSRRGGGHRRGRSSGGHPRRLHYLSVPPAAATSVIEMLRDAGLTERARIIMEKPFGTDLATARSRSTPRCTRSSPRTRCSASTTSWARRRRRTSSPSASRTACSSRSGTGSTSTTSRSTCPRRWPVGTRAGFYEATGAYRDMVVTHLLPGARVHRDGAADRPGARRRSTRRRTRSSARCSRSTRATWCAASTRATAPSTGVDPDSQTETFVALRCEIDNWRWSGVPFFLRTGKRMAEGARIISIAFKEPPRSMFPIGLGRGAASGRTTSPSTWPTRRGCRCRSTASAPAPACGSDKQSLQFSLIGGRPTTWTCSRPTSASSTTR